MKNIFSPVPKYLRPALCAGMRRRVRLALYVSALALGPIHGATAGPATEGAGFRDPLTTPSSRLALPAASQMISIAHAGKKLVAVGRRGIILLSSDAGKSWTQAPSPVSSDLTSVRFSDAMHGWIVGHDAVALKTADGGQSWQRMLDGRSTLKIILDAYQAKNAAGDASVLPLLADARRAAEQSATPGVLPYPLLDVWFSSSRQGFVIGAFGLILHTNDAGLSWTPWIERTDNDRMVHLYGISGAAGEVYLAGEQGFLRRLDSAGERFVKVESPYQGSYFGLYVQKNLLVVHGLRGNAYVSEDAGLQWHKVPTAVASNIIAVLPGNGTELLFVSQAGQVLRSTDYGRSVSMLTAPLNSEIYGAAAGSTDNIITTGLSGVRSVRLPAIRN